MRFSLTALLLAAFWIAAVMLVWVRREPWAADHATKPSFKQYSSSSTDFIRQLRYNNENVEIYDVASGKTLHVFETRDLRGFLQVGFLDDDHILISYNPGTSPTRVCFRRRHPEWWWGHFYRPEVWLALALTIALLWRAVKAWRASRAPKLIPGAPAPPAVPAQRAEIP